MYCVKCCNILNPATSLLLPYKVEPHDCEKITMSLFVTLRSDLQDPFNKSWVNPICWWKFPSWLCYYYPTWTTWKRKPPTCWISSISRCPHQSTSAAIWEHPVSIYTDSWYVFGVIYDLGRLWKQKSFPTSSGTPIHSGPQADELLIAIFFSSEIAAFKTDSY